MPKVHLLAPSPNRRMSLYQSSIGVNLRTMPAAHGDNAKWYRHVCAEYENLLPHALRADHIMFARRLWRLSIATRAEQHVKGLKNLAHRWFHWQSQHHHCQRKEYRWGIYRAIGPNTDPSAALSLRCRRQDQQT
jgi:hypothetical protein